MLTLFDHSTDDIFLDQFLVALGLSYRNSIVLLPKRNDSDLALSGVIRNSIALELVYMLQVTLLTILLLQFVKIVALKSKIIHRSELW